MSTQLCNPLSIALFGVSIVLVPDVVIVVNIIVVVNTGRRPIYLREDLTSDGNIFNKITFRAALVPFRAPTYCQKPL